LGDCFICCEWTTASLGRRIIESTGLFEEISARETNVNCFNEKAGLVKTTH
jgi:hypothetical protein